MQKPNHKFKKYPFSTYGCNDVIRDNKLALVRIAGKFTSDPYEKEELGAGILDSLESFPRL